MVRRSAIPPPKWALGVYGEALRVLREKTHGVGPHRPMAPGHFEELRKETPRRLVVHRVVREHAGGLPPIGAPLAARGEMAQREAERRVLADEAARAVPVDYVNVCIDLDHGR